MKNHKTKENVEKSMSEIALDEEIEILLETPEEDEDEQQFFIDLYNWLIDLGGGMDKEDAAVASGLKREICIKTLNNGLGFAFEILGGMSEDDFLDQLHEFTASHKNSVLKITWDR